MVSDPGWSLDWLKLVIKIGWIFSVKDGIIVFDFGFKLFVCHYINR